MSGRRDCDPLYVFRRKHNSHLGRSMQAGWSCCFCLVMWLKCPCSQTPKSKKGLPQSPGNRNSLALSRPRCSLNHRHGAQEEYNDIVLTVSLTESVMLTVTPWFPRREKSSACRFPILTARCRTHGTNLSVLTLYYFLSSQASLLLSISKRFPSCCSNFDRTSHV